MTDYSNDIIENAAHLTINGDVEHQKIRIILGNVTTFELSPPQAILVAHKLLDIGYSLRANTPLAPGLKVSPN